MNRTENMTLLKFVCSYRFSIKKMIRFDNIIKVAYKT